MSSANANSNKLYLELVSPAKLVFEGEIDEVVAVNEIGEFGILPNHAPFLTSLRPCEFRYKLNGKIEIFIISGGFCEVANNKVTVLVETCESIMDIDLSDAEAKVKDLQSQLDYTSTLSESELQELLGLFYYHKLRVTAAETRK